MNVKAIDQLYLIGCSYEKNVSRELRKRKIDLFSRCVNNIIARREIKEKNKKKCTMHML